MTQPADERQVCAEVRAALALVRRHQPAAIVLRLTCDRHGEVRLWLERVEGVPLAALADETMGPESCGGAT